MLGEAQVPAQGGGFPPFWACFDLVQQFVKALNAIPAGLMVQELGDALAWIAGQSGQVVGEDFDHGDAGWGFAGEGEPMLGQAPNVLDAQFGNGEACGTGCWPWCAPGFGGAGGRHRPSLAAMARPSGEFGSMRLTGSTPMNLSAAWEKRPLPIAAMIIAVSAAAVCRISAGAVGVALR